MHVLVIRPGALGDAILTLPVLHALRLGGATRITLLSTPASWAFLPRDAAPLHMADFGSADWLGLFSAEVPLSIRARELLATVDAAASYLTGDVDTMIGVMTPAGVARHYHGTPPMLSTAVWARPRAHASAVLLEPLRAWLGDAILAQARQPFAAVDDDFLRLRPEEIAAARVALGLRSDARYVSVHPGSGGRSKCWPARNYARLCVELSRAGCAPLVFFGPADDAVRAEFDAALPAGAEITRVNGRSLREVLALLANCAAFVGNDAGVTHLAARACPTLALFGPTEPETWAPLGPTVRILRAPSSILADLPFADVLLELASLLHLY